MKENERYSLNVIVNQESLEGHYNIWILADQKHPHLQDPVFGLLPNWYLPSANSSCSPSSTRLTSLPTTCNLQLSQYFTFTVRILATNHYKDTSSEIVQIIKLVSHPSYVYGRCLNSLQWGEVYVNSSDIYQYLYLNKSLRFCI